MNFLRRPTDATILREAVELTADEAKQLEKAFGDDEFRKLFSAYVNEISDPKYKEETESYIAQLEEQNELPRGKALVRPKAGFVVKCMHQKKRGGGSDKSKLFLNMVYSERIAEPTESKIVLSGSNWSIPFAIGPVRMEHDKSGSNLVPTFDCCFHPLSLKKAHDSKSFLELIVDIARDAVCAAFKMSGDEVEMSPSHTILRGISYKGGTPKTLMVESDQGGSGNGVEDASGRTVPSPTKNGKVKLDASKEPIVPKYKIVERGVFDIADGSL
ncbi:hypothetical protein ACHAWF_017098 [Thalassiosira exigua]